MGICKQSFVDYLQAYPAMNLHQNTYDQSKIRMEEYKKYSIRKLLSILIKRPQIIVEF